MGFSRKKDFSGMPRKEVLESALGRIYRSVTACEQSTAKLKSKLTASGYPDDVIEEALAKVTCNGIVDDRRYCECLVRSTASSGKGLSRIEKEIRSLGISIEDLDAYQEYMERGEDAQIEDAMHILETHPSRAKDQYAACFRRLISKGFPSSIASSATRRYIEMMKDR